MTEEYFILNDALHRIRPDKNGVAVSEMLDNGRWVPKSKPDLIRHFGRPVDPASIPGFSRAVSGPAELPPELRGFNWGAFFLNWIWGLFNNVFAALLTFVPIIGWIMPFVLGFKGNAWAWRNKRWESVEHFKRVQKRWAIAGAIVFFGSFALAGVALYSAMSFLTGSDVVSRMIDEAEADPRVEKAIGTPLDPSFWKDGAFSLSDDGGQASLSFNVTGPKGEGVLSSEAVKTDGEWEIVSLTVLVAGSGEQIVIKGDAPPAPLPRAPRAPQSPRTPGAAPPAPLGQSI